jgi:hypothetical protein
MRYKHPVSDGYTGSRNDPGIYRQRAMVTHGDTASICIDHHQALYLAMFPDPDFTRVTRQVDDTGTRIKTGIRTRYRSLLQL